MLGTQSAVDREVHIGGGWGKDQPQGKEGSNPAFCNGEIGTDHTKS